MVTGIILAAGFSKRFGADKLMLDFRGQPMVEKIIREAQASKLDRLLLIYRSKELEGLARSLGVEAFYNDRAHLGQAESVKLGVKKTQAGSAYMFIMGDQPLVDAEFIDSLLEEYYKAPGLILVPCFGDRRGNPVIFPPELGEELLKLEGDAGGRQIMGQFSELLGYYQVEDERLGRDLDLPEDLDLLED
ncbi:MAG: nucleotidyltransferase family protein [Tissierellia bacterium]|nr:nucleotidyltransferase family protein [Tissierellia bacterium]